MPVLSNPRHEKFAQNLAMGMTQHDAYRLSGYKPMANQVAMRAEANKLRKRPEIRDRTRELQAEVARNLHVSVKSIVDELEISRVYALQCDQPGAAVQASMGKAKLFGLIVDRAEVEAVVRKPARRATTADKALTLEAWEKQFAQAPPQ